MTREASMAVSGQSEVGALKRVLLRHPRDAFVSTAQIDDQWEAFGYRAPPHLERAIAEYEAFVAVLKGAGAEIAFLRGYVTTGLDSIYVRDASVVCRHGVILCNMGKRERGLEPAAHEAVYRDLGVPVLGAITGDGRLEGGDVTWIDAQTIAVGRGYRTNDEGIRQLRHLLGDCVTELLVVPLPHWRGPTDVFHLMSIVSPIDVDAVLVYSPLMPVPFREALLTRGIQLVDVPDREFETMGCNVLAVAPRRCVMLKGNPETRTRLEAIGVEVHEFSGREICIKGAGGPTCLTRPLVRARA